jgi:caffeoyl-CoA O-methyltransferase
VSNKKIIITVYMKNQYLSVIFLTVAISGLFSISADSQALKENPALDEKVKQFLNSRSRQWYDMNVPTADGQLLYDIIVKNNYKSALEIGTSTGHSGIWIAWALSKTGGKLITIEIDEGRHSEAVKNFKEAGLSEYIDARLADAHELVKQLKGPFDFVFSDADKEWYKNYFIDVDPKLKVGGCFTAHNIYGGSGGRGGRGGYGGQGGFLDYVKSLSNYETTVNSNGGGVSISYKKAEK